MQKRIIGFRLLDVAHTGANICERILNVLIDYDLGNRIIAITLDNASVNNVAIETIRPLITGYHDVLLHQRCACHIINLIVKSGLDVVQESIHRIRQGILYLNANPK